MTTVDTRSLKTAPALDFVHFSGVDTPCRTRRLEQTSKQHPPLLQTAPQYRKPTKPPTQLDSFAAWLLARAGLSATIYRPAPLNRRLPAVLRSLGVHSSEAARKLLEAKTAPLPTALDSLLIGVSSFFRDTGISTYVRDSVLPDLLQSRRGVSVVSAGASNGCELYSIAILLAEQGALEGSSLLGIDCRPDATEQACQGRFQDHELTSVDKDLQERYFHMEGAVYRANAALRSAVQWRCADLMTFTPPACDLILFRNVAIYLEEDAAASIWGKLCSVLTPGGFFLTGKTEKPPADLPLQCMSPSVYQKRTPLHD